VGHSGNLLAGLDVENPRDAATRRGRQKLPIRTECDTEYRRIVGQR
jgi:hypothetical protein